MTNSTMQENTDILSGRRQFRVPTAKYHLYLMLSLTFSTGIIDAVGFLGFDRVFTGNMTGNVVILGMALSGTTGLPVLGPAAALVMFFAGAIISGRLLRGQPDGWAGPTSVALLLVTATMLVASVALIVIEQGSFPFMSEAAAALLGLGMGLQAAAARHVKVPDVTTVVVTSTITGLAADSRLGAAKQQDWVKRFMAILLILLGALAGALLLAVAVWIPILLSAILTGTVLTLGHLRMRAEKKEQPRRIEQTP